ncbi:DNA-deoxyinosine glycosylase [Candidatus Bipolaricaulota bacterium]
MPRCSRSKSDTITGLEPIVGEAPRILILGSMPGAQSLAKQAYYIHPRNAFWNIMAELGLASIDETYEARVNQLKSSGVALWDSLKHCVRETSLDADIDSTTEIANDIEELLAAHPTIYAVFFNGAKAEEAFRRHVLPSLPQEVTAALRFERLPSTSPAHTILVAEKTRQWQMILRELQLPDSSSKTSRSRTYPSS